jgi:hypothetical protein
MLVIRIKLGLSEGRRGLFETRGPYAVQPTTSFPLAYVFILGQSPSSTREIIVNYFGRSTGAEIRKDAIQTAKYCRTN